MEKLCNLLKLVFLIFYIANEKLLRDIIFRCSLNFSSFYAFTYYNSFCSILLNNLEHVSGVISLKAFSKRCLTCLNVVPFLKSRPHSFFTMAHTVSRGFSSGWCTGKSKTLCPLDFGHFGMSLKVVAQQFSV